MSINLGQLLEYGFRDIHADVVDGVATGGTTTTIVDSTLSAKPYTENRFRNWIAFISRTTDAAAPQYQYGIATAYVKSSGTITIPTVSATVGSGDEYALCKPDIPLYTAIKLVNDALNALSYSLVDTSLTSDGETSRYTLPIATKGMRPYSIHLRDTDYTLYDAPNWEIESAAAGSTETLVFKQMPIDAMTIVIDYAALHPQLTAYSSSVSEKIHPELARKAVVERFLHWKMLPKRRKLDIANWEQAKSELEMAKREYKIDLPTRKPNFVPVGLYN